MRNVTRHLVRSALALAAATVLGVSTATGAAAGTNGPTIYDTTNYKAWAVFLSWGEHLRVGDTYADGRSAVAVWIVEGGSRFRHCWDNNGANNGYKDCDYAIPDGKKVHYHVCLGNYGTERILTRTCGTWGTMVS
ncbi:hypothetical protein GCM10009801_80250 [Streptomyces albiaxialis]|uniref:Secreted protein n=1 Tax=Streptomyces albiaxialis TaxID=329523 RepID=A0ABN2X741_9ACTN